MVAAWQIFDQLATSAPAEFRDVISETRADAKNTEPLAEKGWPVRYATRRLAWHVLDHAWEIEDRTEPAAG